MALPKKRKFSRRSVSKVVRLNLVCKKKSYGVGLQPELRQVTLKNYFFSSLYLALLSTLYAFSLPMLGGLNSYCASYTLMHVLRPSASLLFKGLSYFNFSVSLFIFSKSVAYIKIVPFLSDARQSTLSSCLRDMGGVPTLHVFSHSPELGKEPAGPTSTLGVNSSEHPISLRSRLLTLAGSFSRNLVEGRWNFLSTVRDYFSTTVKPDSGHRGSLGVVVGDVFRKFFVHTAFYKKTQWKTMFKYYYWTWDPLWMRYRYRIYWAKKAVHYRANQVMFEFFYLRMRAFQPMCHEPLSRQHCQKSIDPGSILSEAESRDNYARLKSLIWSRTLVCRLGAYVGKALLSSVRRIERRVSSPQSFKKTAFISLGASLSLNKLIYLSVDRPVRLRTWEGNLAAKTSALSQRFEPLGQAPWYRRVLSPLFRSSWKSASTNHLPVTSVRTNLCNWGNLTSRISLFVALVAGL